MSSELNLDLLIKLLKMTTSSNDAEALLFVRKANDKLKEIGWDWDRLLRGKITIIADPFDSVPVPQKKQEDSYRPQAAPPAPTYQNAGTQTGRWSSRNQTFNPKPKRRPAPKYQSKLNVSLKDLGL